MVYFSIQSEQDMSDIVTGLLLWAKVSISEEQALQYVNDIYTIAFHIPDLVYHQKCAYLIHKQHGEYQLKYKRNYKTAWYIIYDIDPISGDILITRIINNYMTVA